MIPTPLKAVAALLAVPLLTACATSDSKEPMPEGQFIDWKGAQLFVRDQGAAGGSPVLLIHGASANSSDMQISLVPELMDAHRVVSYDRPALGRSRGWPDGANHLSGQAAAAARVIEASGLERPVVVGHSYGGSVALRLALDYPDLVGGLVLLAAPSHEWEGGVTWYNYWSAAPVLGPVVNHLVVPAIGPRMARSGVESVFAPQEPPANYYDRSDLPLLLEASAFNANAESMVALKQDIIAQQDHYDRLSMPVAILHGEADDTVAAELHAERMAEEIPESRLILLPGMGHMLHHFRQDLIAENIQAVARDAGS